GNRTLYAYDALGQVTRFSYGGPAGSATVTDPLGVVTRYELDPDGRVTAIVVPSASLQPLRRITYTSAGDVASVTDGEGRVTQFSYDSRGNLTLQRDAVGNTVTRVYDLRNQLVGETQAGAGASRTTCYVYDATTRNRVRFVVSPQGRVTEYRYSAFGERTASIEYAGAALAASATLTETSLVQWSAQQDRSATQRVDMAYDLRGELVTRTAYARVDVAGAGIADGSQAVERYVRDASGRLLQVIAADGGVTSYAYDGLGRLVASADAAGRTATTVYDAAARRSTVVESGSGLVTTRSYDAAGRLISLLQSAPAMPAGETRYFYDGAGRLRMTQDATGVRRWLLYDDAGRQVAEIDGNGTLTESRFDASGLLTWRATYATAVDTARLVDSSGRTTLGVALASIRPAASQADQREWFAYDAAGRLVRTARAMAAVTGGTSVAVTETRYDAAGRAVGLTGYANLLVAGLGAGVAGVDALAAGTVSAPAASAQDRVSRNFYDADGLLLGALDAQGYLTSYSYDGTGQLTRSLAYATATNAALRAAGTLAQLIPATSAADARSFKVYDARGNLIGAI
ncbi:MAG TPA: hypothetical protein VLJ62_21800, partial [Burkholderiaceae bacterium]|nr:hypothetical protein [Burkholderiaceae bacterium]